MNILTRMTTIQFTMFTKKENNFHCFRNLTTLIYFVSILDYKQFVESLTRKFKAKYFCSTVSKARNKAGPLHPQKWLLYVIKVQTTETTTVEKYA